MSPVEINSRGISTQILYLNKSGNSNVEMHSMKKTYKPENMLKISSIVMLYYAHRFNVAAGRGGAICAACEFQQGLNFGLNNK